MEQRLSVSMSRMAAMAQPPEASWSPQSHCCRIDSFRVLRQSFCGKFQIVCGFWNPANPTFRMYVHLIMKMMIMIMINPMMMIMLDLRMTIIIIIFLNVKKDHAHCVHLIMIMTMIIAHLKRNHQILTLRHIGKN